MGNIELFLTEDGSHSLYIKSLNESYHSRTGAHLESKHVFIREGLFQLFKSSPPERLQQLKFLHGGIGNRPAILEVGWGTGLNTILTLEQAVFYQYPLHYTALEPHPLPQFIVQELNYPQFIDARVKAYFHLLHELEWELKHPLGQVLANCTFQKHKQRLENFTSEHHYDLVYFDAFARSKQPEIWSLENFKKLNRLIKPDGILVSYASNVQFQMYLQASGFNVTLLPGVGGKREMVRAKKI